MKNNLRRVYHVKGVKSLYFISPISYRKGRRLVECFSFSRAGANDEFRGGGNRLGNNQDKLDGNRLTEKTKTEPVDFRVLVIFPVFENRFTTGYI